MGRRPMLAQPSLAHTSTQAAQASAHRTQGDAGGVYGTRPRRRDRWAAGVNGPPAAWFATVTRVWNRANCRTENEEIDMALQGTIQLLMEGKTLALVSDAGTPGISDPGFLLVRECYANDISVECLPGPTAFVPAIVKSGLPSDRFVFEGFLPHKKGRKTRIENLSKEDRTIIFYESPYRLVKTLEQLKEAFNEDRKASVSRELTKMFEETRNGTLTELASHYTKHPPKGEIVLIVAGWNSKNSNVEDSAEEDIDEENE